HRGASWLRAGASITRTTDRRPARVGSHADDTRWTTCQRARRHCRALRGRSELSKSPLRRERITGAAQADARVLYRMAHETCRAEFREAVARGTCRLRLARQLQQAPDRSARSPG